MNNSFSPAAVAIPLFLLTAIGHGASITLIGGDSARPGETITVPVEVSAATDIAGVNLRLDFDPSVFSSPAVSPDALLVPGHLLDSHAPPETSGRFNVTLHLPAGTLPPGEILTITFQVDADAEPGDYMITYASALPVAPGLTLTSSGLSDRMGTSLDHDPIPAQVTVLPPMGILGDLDDDGTVNENDLFLFLTNWHLSPLSLLKADMDEDGDCDHCDLLLFIDQCHD
jgi:hypothetical protein